MNEEIFTQEQQIEIIKIFKGVLLYARKGKGLTEFELIFLDELLESCNSVISIIKEKEET